MTVRKSLARAIALAVVAASVLMIVGSSSAGVDTRATVFFVHGLPGGGKVDICIGGVGEVTSGLAYAEKDKRKLAPDTYKVKVRKATKADCKGDVIAKGSVALSDFANATLVVRTVDGKASITRFNNDAGPTAPGEIRLTAAHMMKGSAVDVWDNGSVLFTGIARGGTDEDLLTAGGIYSLWGTKTGETAAIVGPRVIDSTSEGQAFTFVMVGTKVANNRLVIFKQDVGTVV